MAELIDLNINIGATTTDLQSSLQKAENLLQQFQNALKKATNVGEINYLNNQIKNLNTTITSVKTQMQGMARPTTDATNALSNLSRVAQDAPYGFIGIANNLNPLLESFQRLQKETGSSKKALLSMVEGLSGAGGLGLALGAISSLAVVFSKDISEAFKGPAEKLKGLREELKKLNDELYKTAGSAQASQTLGTSLVGRITNEQLDITQRENALRKFKELYSQNKEIKNLEIKDLKTYNAQYLQSLNNKAAVQQLEVNKEKNYVDALSAANAEFKRLTEERENKKKNTLATTKQLESGVTTEYLRSQIDAQYIKPLKEAQKNIDNAKASLQRTLDVTTLYDNSETEKASKTKKAPIVNYVKETNNELSLELARMKALRDKMKSIGLDFLKTFELPSDKRAAEKKRKGYFQGKTKDLLDSTEEEGGFGAFMGKQYQKDKSKIALEDEQLLRVKELTLAYNDFAYSLSQNVTGALMSVWDAMQEGVSPLEAIGQMFANIGKQLAAAVIQALIFKALLDAFPELKGVFTAIGGTGGGGIGKFLGLASGGVATGPTLAMIGEGSESEAVLPLSKLSGMLNTSFNAGAMNSGGTGSSGQFVLRGQDLLLSVNRAQKASNLKGQNISLA